MTNNDCFSSLTRGFLFPRPSSASSTKSKRKKPKTTKGPSISKPTDAVPAVSGSSCSDRSTTKLVHTEITVSTKQFPAAADTTTASNETNVSASIVGATDLRSPKISGKISNLNPPNTSTENMRDQSQDTPKTKTSNSKKSMGFSKGFLLSSSKSDKRNIKQRPRGPTPKAIEGGYEQSQKRNEICEKAVDPFIAVTETRIDTNQVLLPCKKSSSTLLLDWIDDHEKDKEFPFGNPIFSSSDKNDASAKNSNISLPTSPLVEVFMESPPDNESSYVKDSITPSEKLDVDLNDDGTTYVKNTLGETTCCANAISDIDKYGTRTSTYFPDWSIRFAQSLAEMQVQVLGKHRQTRERGDLLLSSWLAISFRSVDHIFTSTAADLCDQQADNRSTGLSASRTRTRMTKENVRKLYMKWTWNTLLEEGYSSKMTGPRSRSDSTTLLGPNKRSHRLYRYLSLGLLMHPQYGKDSINELCCALRVVIASSSLSELPDSEKEEKDKTLRRHALQGLYFLEYCLDTIDGSEDISNAQEKQETTSYDGVSTVDNYDTILGFLLESAVPTLIDLVVSQHTQQAKKRSILSQFSAELAWRVIASCCEREALIARLDPIAKNGKFQASERFYNNSSRYILLGINERISQLLSVQLDWVQARMSGSDGSDGTMTTTQRCRLECQRAVLQDWQIILSKVSHQKRVPFTTEVSREISVISSSFAGIELHMNERKNASLFGGIRQSITNSSFQISHELDVNTIFSAIDCLAQTDMESTHETGSGSFIIPREIRSRCILRGILTWLESLLGKKSKNKTTKPMPWHEDIFVRILHLSTLIIGNITTVECANLLAALLEILGLYCADIIQIRENGVTNVISVLYDSFKALVGHLVSKELDHDVSAVLQSLVITFIYMQDDEKLVHFLASDSLMKHEIIVRILVDLCQKKQSSDGIFSLKAESVAPDAAASVLIEQCRVNPTVQEVLTQQVETWAFSACNMSVAIPKLINLLAQMHRKDPMTCSNSPDALQTLVKRILTSTIGFHARRDNESCRSVMCMVLECLNEDSTDLNPEKVCSAMGKDLRRRLLPNSDGGEETNMRLLGKVLVAICEEMLLRPSRILPLTLLGSLVDADKNFTDPASRACVADAIISLLELSLREFQTLSDQGETLLKDEIIFRRLAPLLFLRRLPHEYFRATWSTLFEEEGHCKSILTLFESLSSALAVRLGIGVDTRIKQATCYSAEERRLAAEIAGRALPFSSRDSRMMLCSCSQTICQPAFESLFTLLQRPTTFVQDLTAGIRSARAALCSVCNFVPLARPDDDGIAILKVSLFAIRLLSTEIQDSTNKQLVDEYRRLQTGCMDFLSICVMRLLQEERQLPYKAPDGCAPPVISFPEALAILYSLMKNTVCNAREENANIMSYVDHGRGSYELTEAMYDANTCTCIWNSFIAVAQRIEPQDGYLQKFANNSLEWILQWLECPPSAVSSVAYDLSVSAAMRLILILMTRLSTSSPTFLSDLDNRIDLLNVMQNRVVKVLSNDEADSSHLARLEALKLLVFWISFHVQDGKSIDAKKQKQVFEIMATFTKIAKYDSNEAVQSFANQVVAMLGRD